MRISDWSSDVCSSDLWSLTRAPPPRINRRASPLDAARPARRRASITGKLVQSIVDSSTSTVGKPSAVAPASKVRSEEHTSELQSLMRISYAVFCLKKKKTKKQQHTIKQ